MATLSEKKKKIVDYVTKVYKTLDPSGYNSDRFKEFVEGMSENQFKEFVKKIKNGEYHFSIEMPNMVARMEVDNIYKAAEITKTKLFHRLQTTDPGTGVQYLTDEEYPVMLLPCRRTQQTIEHKMSLPKSDKTVNAMTGQVTGPDKASSINKEEIQILYNRGLTNTLKEFLNIRAGNPELYSKYSQQLEETGQANIDTDDPADRTRTSQTANVLLHGMHIASNI